jgi:hypothetical protein
MSSTNNIFPELEEKIFKRYSKVPVHMLSGMRPDPYETRKSIPWILQSKDKNYNIKAKHLEFEYEDEVIELYSQFEVDTFKRLNKNLFDQGFFKEYAGEQAPVNTTNTISDNELENIANIRSNEAFAVEINKLTSPLTLERLKQIATAAGKSVKKIQLIDSRIEALEDGDN